MPSGLAVSFSGRMASGKTHVTHTLSRILGWPRVGFSDYLKVLLQQKGIAEPDREQLQNLGQSLVERDPDDFCCKVLAQAQFVPGSSILIDGIRHMDIQRRLEKLVSPSVAILIHLAPDQATVAERIKTRGVSVEELRRAEEHIVESELLESLPANANSVVDSGMPVEEVLSKCLAAMEACGAAQALVEQARRKIRTRP